MTCSVTSPRVSAGRVRCAEFVGPTGEVANAHLPRVAILTHLTLHCGGFSVCADGGTTRWRLACTAPGWGPAVGSRHARRGPTVTPTRALRPLRSARVDPYLGSSGGGAAAREMLEARREANPSLGLPAGRLRRPPWMDTAALTGHVPGTTRPTHISLLPSPGQSYLTTPVGLREAWGGVTVTHDPHDGGPWGSRTRQAPLTSVWVPRTVSRPLISASLPADLESHGSQPVGRISIRGRSTNRRSVLPAARGGGTSARTSPMHC